MSLEKKKRFVSKENLQIIRDLPCSICLKNPPSDPDHFKGRGAGGGDELENLLSLCRPHHTLKGWMGVKSFYEKYKMVIKYNRTLFGLPDLKL